MSKSETFDTRACYVWVKTLIDRLDIRLEKFGRDNLNVGTSYNDLQQPGFSTPPPG